jgi:adenosylhomocysteinase
MEKDGALKYPIMAVNDNKTKHLFDNYYGTGQSTIDGILRATNVLFAGKTVVVAGYGDCGKGVALRARGMSANVVVCEVNPVAALQAYADGFSVMPMMRAAEIGDIFITVTGNKHILDWAHVEKMKSGAILANSGHFNVEINVDEIDKRAKSKRRVRWQLDEYVLPSGRKVFLCGEGRLVNLAVAEGHPSEVMDLSFCGQALALEYGIKNRGKLNAGVHVLPSSVDAGIAQLKLDSLGIKKDSMTPEQLKYSQSWEEGT